MLAFSRQQRDGFRRAQLDGFAAQAELFLRRHFAARLRRCSSEEVREAALRVQALGQERGLTRRGELLGCLACACVCGVSLFDDPRCVWLFHQDPRPDRLAPVLDFNIDTFTTNLGASVDEGLFSADALADCEDLVLVGEQRLQEAGGTLERALLAMTPARAQLLATPHARRFLTMVEAEAERQQLGPRARTRHALIAWLLGVGFLEDPLCRPVLPFLRAAETDASRLGG